MCWRRLQYPDVPCLNVGTPRKPNYLPAELCTIAPGQRRLKLDERQARLAGVHCMSMRRQGTALAASQVLPSQFTLRSELHYWTPVHASWARSEGELVKRIKFRIGEVMRQLFQALAVAYSFWSCIQLHLDACGQLSVRKLHTPACKSKPVFLRNLACIYSCFRV